LYDENTGSKHPLSTQGEIVVGPNILGGNYGLFGFTHFAARDHQIELRQSAKWSIHPKLQLEGTLRSYYFYDSGNLWHANHIEFYEKELVTKTEWRCWILGFLIRERRGGFEFQFNIELKLDSQPIQKQKKTQVAEEFYPWRGENTR
jgi:hypothetical protein